MKHAPGFPVGWRVVFTGRLASMSRAAGARILTEQGGTVFDRVSQRTDLLVIGADGWPLRKSGSITRNLRRASELQDAGGSVTIVGEAEFFRRLNHFEETEPIRRLHTLEQLSRLLGISGLRLRRWIDLGLIEPHDPSAIAPMFGYQEVAAAKSLSRLIARGVSPCKLAGNLRKLQRWLPDHRGLFGSIVALEKRLLIRDGSSLIDATGQLHFTFDEPLVEMLTAKSPIIDRKDDPDMLFDRAYHEESDGRYEQAMDSYLQWLDRFGEDHEVLFNLANIYFHHGKIELSESFYRRCVATNPTYARAWNNLGLCLLQLDDRSSAIEALRRSVDLDPNNLDTLFNLADMLDEAGSESEARLLWLRIARYPAGASDELVQYGKKRCSELAI